MKVAVEVVYAEASGQTVIRIDMDEGATIDDALAASGIFARHPDLDPGKCTLGIWGRAALRSQPLRDRDRVEIYRPLLADPKEVRRARAQRERKRPSK